MNPKINARMPKTIPATPISLSRQARAWIDDQAVRILLSGWSLAAAATGPV